MGALDYWVQEIHVDGFHFNLASVLFQDQCGQPTRSSPILWDIESDPRMADTRIIAQAWDAAGFSTQWEPSLGTDGLNGIVAIATTFAVSSGETMAPSSTLRRGSSAAQTSTPLPFTPYTTASAFTSHDGFALNDLVSHNRRHNLANRENNEDGADET